MRFYYDKNDLLYKLVENKKDKIEKDVSLSY